MSQYDFSLESKPTTSKQKQQTTTDALANYYAGGTLIGFVLGTNVTSRKKYFPPPVLPQGFKPVHVARKSRFEPAPTEKVSLSKEEQSHTSRRKGLQRHNLTAADRAHILSETTAKSAVQNDNVRSSTQDKCERLPAAELKSAENSDVFTTGYSHFKPFVAHPEKQKRYEQYLSLCKVGQKGRVLLHLYVNQKLRAVFLVGFHNIIIQQLRHFFLTHLHCFSMHLDPVVSEICHSARIGFFLDLKSFLHLFIPGCMLTLDAVSSRLIL